MPYREELRRPDLKGVFTCNLCNKSFCHSSSLSRHRMQTHFKSYTCTLCNREINNNETLRAHMYRNHQISRMFLCKCCNWAFPDKTSHQLHIQAMQTTCSPGNVTIIAKGPNTGENGVSLSPISDHASSSGSPPPLQNGLPGIFPQDDLFTRIRQQAMFDVNRFIGEFHRERKAAQEKPLELTTKVNDGNNNAVEGQTMEDGKYVKREDDMADLISGPEDDDDDKKQKATPPGTCVVMPDDRPVVSSTSNPQPKLETKESVRGAIGASPLHSLLYQKKFSNAVRKPSSPPAPMPNAPLCLDLLQQRAHDLSLPMKISEANAMAFVQRGLGSPASQASNSSGSPPGAKRPKLSSSSVSSRGDSGLSSPCADCTVLKSQSAVAENRVRYFQNRMMAMEMEVKRSETIAMATEAKAHHFELQARALKSQCQTLENKLLMIQEVALQLQKMGKSADEDSARAHVQQLLDCCQIDNGTRLF